MPIGFVSIVLPEEPVLFNIKYTMPQKLSSTPDAFFRVIGSLSTMAAINMVYIGDIEATMEQSIGVMSGIAIKNVI